MDSVAVAGSRLVSHTYDQSVRYISGTFIYDRVNEAGKTILSSPPQPPQKEWTQSILKYTGTPQVSEYETVLKKVVPGKDGRMRITNTTDRLHAIHVQLTVFKNRGEWGGTASVVGPCQLLTCGHNVYDPKGKKWAERILAYPALNKKVAPFGVVEVVKAYTFADWTERGDSKYDIALLIINQPIGLYTGWGGILSTHDQALVNEQVTITGYPADKNFDEMWSMSHTLKTIYPESFDYLHDTFGGQSGSPISINRHALTQIIGVHTLGFSQVNSGVRISSGKFTTLFIKVMSEHHALAAHPQVICGPTYAWPTEAHKITIRAHSGPVNFLAVLPNGTLASASDEIKLWDPSTGDCLRTITGTGFVTSLVALPNGTLASGSDAQTI